MKKKDNPDGDSIAKLNDKIRQWLLTEGYPLEFATAAEFRKNGFRVWQGFHVKDTQAGAPREIDVLAEQTIDIGDAFVRIYHVVECKWSREKPWVIFTSDSGRMAPSACVAQTIGSKAGDTILWAIAGDPAMHALDYFAVPARPGFGGRQVFAKGQDVVYAALQAVSSLATLSVQRYDAHNQHPSDALKLAVAAFPVVVVDGELFEGFFDSKTGTVQVEPVDRLRLHWKGAEAWPFHATIDVVRAQALSPFVTNRANETAHLLTRMGQSLKELRESFEKRNPKLFTITEGPRGMQGLPALLIDLKKQLQQISKKRRVISPGV